MPARKKSGRRAKSLKRSRSRRKVRTSKSGRRVPVKSGRRGRSVSSIQLPLEGPKGMEDVKFNSYIKKVLRKVNPRVNINNVSMKIVDSLVKDTLHQIAQTASCKMGKRKTLKPKMCLRAMKRVLPKSMALKADEHAQKVMDRYSNKCKRR